MTGYFYSCGPDNQVTCGAEHLMVSHFYGTVYAQSRATTSNNSGAGEDNANGLDVQWRLPGRRLLPATCGIDLQA